MDTQRPLYIFDLDGTLSLPHHRRHLVGVKSDPARWRRFSDACEADPPNAPVIETMERLKRAADVWIFSGRTERVREMTVRWLERYTSFTGDELETALNMRPVGDTRPDTVLKQEMLDRMLLVDRKRLVAIFDDRQRVVDMWRANDIMCFQVEPFEAGEEDAGPLASRRSAA